MTASIVRLGHPILRFPAEPVDVDRLKSGQYDDLLSSLKSTLIELDTRSLAAPQLGSELQVLAFRSEVFGEPARGHETKIVVNPMLELEHAELVYDWESCLSIPDLKGLVPRYPSVRLRGIDEVGELVDFVAVGEDARTLQHAHDHLGGLVFLDRMRDLRSLAFGDEWDRFLDTDETAPGDPPAES